MWSPLSAIDSRCFSKLVESILEDMRPGLRKGTGLKDKNLLRAWSTVCSYSAPPKRFLSHVDGLLTEFPSCVHNLTRTKGSDGKSTIDTASKAARAILTKHLLFCDRYILIEVVHRGQNNVLVEAKDLKSKGDYKAVFQAFVAMENKVNQERAQDAAIEWDKKHNVKAKARKGAEDSGHNSKEDGGKHYGEEDEGAEKEEPGEVERVAKNEPVVSQLIPCCDKL